MRLQWDRRFLSFILKFQTSSHLSGLGLPDTAFGIITSSPELIVEYTKNRQLVENRQEIVIAVHDQCFTELRFNPDLFRFSGNLLGLPWLGRTDSNLTLASLHSLLLTSIFFSESIEAVLALSILFSLITFLVRRSQILQCRFLFTGSKGQDTLLVTTLFYRLAEFFYALPIFQVGTMTWYHVKK